MVVSLNPKPYTEPRVPFTSVRPGHETLCDSIDAADILHANKLVLHCTHALLAHLWAQATLTGSDAGGVAPPALSPCASSAADR